MGGQEKDRLGELYSGFHQAVCRQVLTGQPGDLDEENKTRKKAHNLQDSDILLTLALTQMKDSPLLQLFRC